MEARSKSDIFILENAFRVKVCDIVAIWVEGKVS